MNIQEATRQALETGSSIYRRHWVNEGLPMAITPTNTPACCIVSTTTKAPCPRWNPMAEDLLADDWDIRTEVKT